MLAFQAVERVEPFLDPDQATRIGGDALGVVAQLRRHVADLDVQRRDPLGDRVEGRVEPGRAGQLRFGLGQGGRRAAAFEVGPGQPGVGSRRRLGEALGMAQPLAVDSQRRALLGVRFDLLDLGELIPIEVEVTLPRAFALAQLGQLGGEAPDLAVGFAVGVAERQVLDPGEAVQHLHLGRGDRQLAVLVLAEEGDQAPAQRLQVGRRGAAPGDEGAGSPARRDPPSQHHLVGVLGEALGELGQLRVVEQAGGQVEDALDPGLGGTRPHDPRFRLAAHQQVERVRQHRLPRPGLPGDRVQARAQPQFGPVDQQKVLDP